MDVAVIGAGQAGLSAGYFLRRFGLAAHEGFVVLDHSPGPGGAWQHRWPSLKLGTTNHVHELPGLALDSTQVDVSAAEVVPEYFARYEQHFGLPVLRPVHTSAVRLDGSGFVLETDHGQYRPSSCWTRSLRSPPPPGHPGASQCSTRASSLRPKGGRRWHWWNSECELACPRAAW